MKKITVIDVLALAWAVGWFWRLHREPQIRSPGLSRHSTASRTVDVI
jgi:hypothetical protein